MAADNATILAYLNAVSIAPNDLQAVAEALEDTSGADRSFEHSVFMVFQPSPATTVFGNAKPSRSE